MPFRELILFHLTRFLLSGDESSLAEFSSLCQGFQVDARAVVEGLGERRFSRLAAQAAACRVCLPEVTLSFPEDALREVLRLRLSRFSRVVRATARLDPAMRGVAVVAGREVSVRDADERMMEFLEAEYDPELYRYSAERVTRVKTGARILACGVARVSFLAYAAANVVVNRDAAVVVTERCLDGLLRPENRHVLQGLFARGTGVNAALRRIFYFLEGGHSLYGAESMSDRSASKSILSASILPTTT
ncbi:transcriptional elongation factor [Squirrelpox virus]|uniref:Late transcription elongation factor OPG087 n=1 Tax=Squirrelpox virus TaxID=240426 RepID=U3UBG7_9POXV|nr:transcriptional elongation factor [Squirrelpox virus]CCD83229.1 transcriptional elongation factor [Squirrelpox virus]